MNKRTKLVLGLVTIIFILIFSGIVVVNIVDYFTHFVGHIFNGGKGAFAVGQKLDYL